MIIFDLDGTLADCEHRRHFVDPEAEFKLRPEHHEEGFCLGWLKEEAMDKPFGTFKNKDVKIWKPDWKAFYEACDEDERIIPTWKMFVSALDTNSISNVQIWSGRCESVREKTESWLGFHLSPSGQYPSKLILKMRPIGDYTPDDQLKERWLDEWLSLPSMDMANGSLNKIEMVFDDRKKVIEMWKRRGIFVFDVSQGKGDF